MAKLKSQVCFAKGFYTSLFRDLATSHPEARLSLSRDLDTILSRLDSEGLGFATLTLSRLGKAIDLSFETKKLIVPTSFKRYKSTALPHFLRGLLVKVYTSDGTLREDADVVAVCDLRQLLFFAYKLQLPYTKEKSDAVISSFEETEAELFELSNASLPSDSKRVLLVARDLCTSLFENVQRKDILPRHGPGAVATGEKFEKKWEFSRLYSNLHSAFPYYEYFVVNSRSLLDSVKWYRSLERLEVGTAKVVLVPKDARGPRLISEEPLEYQYIQQGIRLQMQKHLESHPLTRGHVNFTHQSVNQKLALSASSSGSHATLDMKEASDRVSTSLVEFVYGGNPDYLKGLLSCRTDKTQLPDGRILALKKYAPMGSAVCFPVESTIFYLLSVSALIVEYGLSVRKAKRAVYVYGDDLIVKTEYVDSVLKHLPFFGLMFNRDKCFTTGPFRESCGIDAFNGSIVTPHRWRQPWPKKRTDGKALSSLVELSNALYCSGYWHSSYWLQSELVRHCGFLPTVPHQKSAGYLSFVTCHKLALMPNKRRWCPATHQYLYRVKRVKTRLRASKLDGWSRLLQNSTSGVVDTFTVPMSVAVKHGWSRI